MSSDLRDKDEIARTVNKFTQNLITSSNDDYLVFLLHSIAVIIKPSEIILSVLHKIYALNFM